MKILILKNDKIYKVFLENYIKKTIFDKYLIIHKQ